MIAENVPVESWDDIERVLSSRVWINAADYWIPYDNARITRVDEECFGRANITTTGSIGSFSPIFIMDHPVWDDDDPRRQRNVLDRETFDKPFRQAVARVYPSSKSTLTDTFASSKGVSL
ncbi:hypothetical protein JB92DRAFT_3116438 [Gautieria morchelliformis]|nr:hypothetical protein JB92DRAFT_3116438 [Gautieria morchelliformis]